MTPKRILVTGAAGFIGSAVARRIIEATPHEVLVYDKLTYAGNLASLAPIEANARYRFLQADICDPVAARDAFDSFKPDWVMHLAAESHVDRSIDGPGEFIQTNSSALTSCCRRRSVFGAASRRKRRRLSASITFQPTKSSVRSAIRVCSARTRPMRPTRPIRPPRPAPTILSAPGITPTDCRWWRPIAPTITAPTTSRKS